MGSTFRSKTVSKQRQKGTSFEVSLLPLLRQHYPDAERRPAQGTNDKGDFLLPGERRLALEAKAHARLNLPEWVAEAKVEAENFQPGSVGVVVHKRHGKTDPALQWVTLELGEFLRLVNELSEPSHRAFT